MWNSAEFGALVWQLMNFQQHAASLRFMVNPQFESKLMRIKAIAGGNWCLERIAGG
jgi:hypothetical protein